MYRRMKIPAIILVCLVAATVTTAKVPSNPKYTLKSVDDKVFTPQILRGRAVFITFFARGCKPCEKEVPFLNELMKKYPDTLVIIGIGFFERDPKETLSLSDKWNIKYPVCVDPDGRAAKAFNVSVLPRGFLLDYRGHIIASYKGMNNKSKNNLLDKLASLQSKIVNYQKNGPSFYIKPLEEATASAVGLSKLWSEKISTWLEEKNVRIASSPQNADYTISGSVSKIRNITGVEIAIFYEGDRELGFSEVLKTSDDSEVKETLIDNLKKLPYVIRGY